MSLENEILRVTGGIKSTLKILINKMGGNITDESIDSFPDLIDSLEIEVGQSKIMASGILKGDGGGNVTAATHEDYVAPEDLKDYSPSDITESNKELSQKFWRGTKAEYDSIVSKDTSTLYIVLDDDEEQSVTLAENETDLPVVAGDAAIGQSIKAARADHVHPKEVNDECRTKWDSKQDAIKAFWVTLSKSAWSNITDTTFQQTVLISEVTSEKSKQFLQPVPAKESLEHYQACGVLMSDQSDGSVTFTCATCPSDDIYMWVIVHPVKYVPLRNIIHFTLSNQFNMGIDSSYLITYEAEKGMTWREFCASGYNTKGFTAHSSSDEDMPEIGGYTVVAKCVDEIIDGETYNVSY